MWKIKLQKIIGNLLARLDELQIVHEWNGHLEIFSRVTKILGKICFSEQIFYRKQSLDALDQSCEKKQQ